MKPILRVNQLKKTYHTKQGETPAIDEVSFSLEPGEFIAIVGPSGCGKSTILSVLCNLLENQEERLKRIKILLLDICYNKIVYFLGEQF